MVTRAIYPNVSLSKIILPKFWWQLPFAFALATSAIVSKCQLCGLNACSPVTQENLANNINPHWFNRQRFLCQSCHDSVAWQESTFSLEFSQTSPLLNPITGIASSFYRYPLDTVMRGFKNQHQLYQLPLLIHAIRQLELPDGCHAGNSLIIPMPTTPKRLTERGFDPVTLLVQYLSFHWQVPIFPHIVREERQKQQGLTRSERLQNTENAFAMTMSPFLDKHIQHLIVFDDVATTGATLQALCQTILNEFPQADFTLHVRALAHGSP